MRAKCIKPGMSIAVVGPEVNPSYDRQRVWNVHRDGPHMWLDYFATTSPVFHADDRVERGVVRRTRCSSSCLSESSR